MSDINEATNEDVKPLSIEESFEAIESIIEQMEQPTVTLEQSFALYREGIKQLANCNERLDMVAKQLIVLDNEE
jgi:exodeoxyribonuclease VII small subunit